MEEAPYYWVNLGGGWWRFFVYVQNYAGGWLEFHFMAHILPGPGRLVLDQVIILVWPNLSYKQFCFAWSSVAPTAQPSICNQFLFH